MTDGHSTRASILLVEDNSMQRMSAAEGLRVAGFDVVEAGGIDAAITELDRREGLSAMVTDVDLVGETMTGMMLARAVAARWPEIAILVVSGVVCPTEDQLPDDARFLPKPYTERQLSSAVRALLEQRAESKDELEP